MRGLEKISVLCYNVHSKKSTSVGVCGSCEVGWIYGFGVLTTILTIYRSGLRGNYGLCGTEKHGFRTKKHGKARKMRQKTDAFAFGSTMLQVRVLSLRPNRKRMALPSSFYLPELPADSKLLVLLATPIICAPSPHINFAPIMRANVGSESCHFDHMKIIRTFSYLESRSDYLFYSSIPTLIARNENSLRQGFSLSEAKILLHKLIS